MSFSFIFALYLTFAFSQSLNDNSNRAYNSFSFVTSNKKEFTLSLEDSPLNKNKSLFSSLLSLFSNTDSKENSKRWYYVHVYDNYLSNVQEYVQLLPSDQIIKNTFILYLSLDQIEKISPYSLIKQMESSDKIDEIAPFNSTDYLYVKTSSDYDLTAHKYYSIDKKINSDSYIVKVNQKRHIKKVAKMLSEDPAVQIVATYKRPVEENLVNVGYLQKNDQNITRGGYLNIYKLDRYVHDHGLTGEGQKVTLIDTAVDFRHAMFRDDNVQVKFNETMPNHRKIFYYYSKISMDEWKKTIPAATHGTHVAGTLAGKSIVDIGKESINSLFDGSAPDAKIVYAGVYGETTAAELEKIMKEQGSRISSNSWGDDEKFVDNMNHEWGSLAHRNPQSLFVFAAGNHGQGEIGYTIVDPGGSKNILAVAYSTSPVFLGSNFYTLHKPNDPSFVFYLYTMYMNDLYQVADKIGTKKGESKIIGIDSRKTDEESLKETCKTVNGSHVIIFYGDTDSDAYINEQILANCEDNTFSDGMLVTANASLIEDLIKSQEKVAIVFEQLTDSLHPVERGNRGSLGPGNKGIMKPDVIAPGDYVLSASSFAGDIEKPEDNFMYGGLASKSGSSMATPNVAGAAALISQYFKSGRWADKVELDGNTLRALIINSAKHPSDSLTPDLVYGHGFVDISKALPLENEFGVQITRQDKKPSIGENGHLTATVHVNKPCTLQVTLSYLDPMLHENSPIPLTRDLDLVVVNPGGSKQNGDHLKADTQHLSTNEKVIFDAFNVGDYTIHIFAGKFFDSSVNKENLQQEFAVVATGEIDNGYIEFKQATTAPCKKTDPDHPDHCLCNDKQIGPSCKTTITNLVNQSSFYSKMSPMEITRVKFTSPSKIISLKSYHSASFIHPSIWISKTCHLSLNEYELNGKVGNMKVNEIEIPFQTNEICVAIFNNNYLKETFFHVEVYSEPEYPANEGNGERKISKKFFFIVTGVLAGIIFVILIAIIITLVIVRKKSSPDDFKSEQINTRSTPLLQTF